MNKPTIEENTKLILKVIYDLFGTEDNAEKNANKTNNSLDDIKQVGLIALWTATRTFDQSKGNKFSTYAYPIIKREIIRLVANNKQINQKAKTESLFKKITCDNENETFLIDVIEDNKSINTESYVIDKISNEHILNNLKLTKKQEEVLNLRRLGFTYRQIAKLLNYTNQNVTGHMNGIKKKINNILYA